VLFLVFGSSASGKTSALDALRPRPPERLAIHDFDEIGIPSGATKRFRHEANERWVRRALEYQHAGVRAEWMRRHAADPRHLPEV